MFKRFAPVNKIILGLLVGMPLGLSTASYGAWTKYFEGDGHAPNGDCLEMICPFGCVEDDENNFFGHCCPTAGRNGDACTIDLCCQSGMVCGTDKKCKYTTCQIGTITYKEGDEIDVCHYCHNGVSTQRTDGSNKQSDGKCCINGELKYDASLCPCIHFHKNEASSKSGQDNKDDLGCCNDTPVKNPERGTKGWMFRGYAAGTDDFYGCCSSDRVAGKNCCESGEKVCSKTCCADSENCCSSTCCSASCNAAGNDCCADRSFGNRTPFINEECEWEEEKVTVAGHTMIIPKYVCEDVERFKWIEDNTQYKVDSQKDMILTVDIIGIVSFDYMTVRDNNGDDALSITSFSGDSINREVTLKAGHTYTFNISLTNACGGSCNITASCQ